MTLFGPDGSEQLHDSGGLAEPTLDFNAHEAGGYRFRVEDRAYTRDASSFYRLAIFTGPRLVAAFPQVLTRGRAGGDALRLSASRRHSGGEFLAPGLQQIKATIDAPETGDLDGGGWTLTNAAMLDGFSYDRPGTYGRLRFELVDAEVTLETDTPHQTLATAQKDHRAQWGRRRTVPPPRRGRLVSFLAQKGQSFEIETVGEHAGWRWIWTWRSSMPKASC